MSPAPILLDTDSLYEYFSLRLSDLRVHAGTFDEMMNGCLIGKRYVNKTESIEVLCVKTGEGSLYCNDEELMTKDTKKLPSSD